MTRHTLHDTLKNTYTHHIPHTTHHTYLLLHLLRLHELPLEPLLRLLATAST